MVTILILCIVIYLIASIGEDSKGKDAVKHRATVNANKALHRYSDNFSGRQYPFVQNQYYSKDGGHLTTGYLPFFYLPYYRKEVVKGYIAGSHKPIV